MSDNLNILQPQDPKQINVHEAWELAYWSRKFSVTEEELKAAVEAVGTQAADVAKYLGK